MKFLCTALLLLGYTAYASDYKQTDNGVILKTDAAEIKVDFYSPGIVRVVKSPLNHDYTKNSLSVVKELQRVKFSVTKGSDQISMKSDDIQVYIGLNDGNVSFSDKSGK